MEKNWDLKILLIIGENFFLQNCVFSVVVKINVFHLWLKSITLSCLYSD